MSYGKKMSKVYMKYIKLILSINKYGKIIKIIKNLKKNLGIFWKKTKTFLKKYFLSFKRKNLLQKCVFKFLLYFSSQFYI